VVDLRLASFVLVIAVLGFVTLVRPNRGDPPEEALDVDIPTGIELTVDDGRTIKTYRYGRRVLVGRAAGADLRIEDDRVSRLHARLEMRDDGVYVEDLGSRNGTELNGERVENAKLRVDDEVTVGPATLIFRGVGAWT
jgi:pSer/pThr/pTyr-binding forkhead associated (FHA) protein